jgi:hypothetical protein
MRSFAARHVADRRSLLLLAPGWVRIPNLVRTIAAQRGKAGLQYLDYLGRTVPW